MFRRSLFLTVGLISSNLSGTRSEARGVQNSFLLALVAGLSSAGTAAALGNVTAKHVTKATQDLQSQFDDVYQGNFETLKLPYILRMSSDSWLLGFNRMTRVILTTTQEASKKSRGNRTGKRRFAASGNSLTR